MIRKRLLATLSTVRVLLGRHIAARRRKVATESSWA
ncbi:hypothetical protein FB004_102567 [Sinorhizobium medicae]|uniref:Uncharacterized protein n=1 Tax=Sinorhizobium medicae TaxID=110321 RepID=A0A508X737_9HYPH|nr:hypothetical protein FB006_10471 [Sinorhizobium medicae]TWA27588.1 hypothetical protein FB004_102567 [Sinorhizobium medicae]TWA35226.1 hypothetical protein FB007_10672 [Sinorhizobium medicae]TWA43339.1 hypothetical protein FB009_102103 [Sinorhizobium medicae]TWA45747.1 hypothetical protein FB005_105337 [Sinorhizobium medicae]